MEAWTEHLPFYANNENFFVDKTEGINSLSNSEVYISHFTPVCTCNDHVSIPAVNVITPTGLTLINVPGNRPIKANRIAGRVFFYHA